MKIFLLLMTSLFCASTAWAGVEASVVAMSEFVDRGYSQTQSKPTLQLKGKLTSANGLFVEGMGIHVEHQKGSPELQADIKVGYHGQFGAQTSWEVAYQHSLFAKSHQDIGWEVSLHGKHQLHMSDYKPFLAAAIFTSPDRTTAPSYAEIAIGMAITDSLDISGKAGRWHHHKGNVKNEYDWLLSLVWHQASWSVEGVYSVSPNKNNSLAGQRFITLVGWHF